VGYRIVNVGTTPQSIAIAIMTDSVVGPIDAFLLRVYRSHFIYLQISHALTALIDNLSADVFRHTRLTLYDLS
jgi:hypothetical protein